MSGRRFRGEVLGTELQFLFLLRRHHCWRLPVLHQHLGVQMRGEMRGCSKKTRMKVCCDHNQTEDLILCRERAGRAVLSLLRFVMDLLVDGPGLVLRSVPRNRPTPDNFQLVLLVWLVLPDVGRDYARSPNPSKL
jgi:hypothetical protein